MKFSLKHFSILLLAAAGLLLAGCSKDSTEPEVEVSADASLKRFSFQSSVNTGLNSTCTSYEGAKTIYITVPEGVSMSSLIPTFSIQLSIFLLLRLLQSQAQLPLTRFLQETEKAVLTTRYILS